MPANGRLVCPDRCDAGYVVDEPRVCAECGATMIEQDQQRVEDFDDQ